jgi:hypothetical protein
LAIGSPQSDLAIAGDCRWRIPIREPSLMFVRTYSGDLISLVDFIRFTQVEHEDGGPAIVVAVMRTDGALVKLSRHYTLEALGRVLEPRR